MPNWCDNNLVLTHKDPAMIKRAQEALEKGQLFNEFIPMPKALTPLGIELMIENGDYFSELNNFMESLNIKYYGVKSWYEWCLKNWGTKWDIGENSHITLIDENNLNVNFSTAWSPPTDFYEKLTEFGFNVLAYYYESGMNFCGVFESIDGEVLQDETINIEGDASWVEANVPYEINHAFAISENMDYEDEVSTTDES